MESVYLLAGNMPVLPTTLCCLALHAGAGCNDLWCRIIKNVDREVKIYFFLCRCDCLRRGHCSNALVPDGATYVSQACKWAIFEYT